LGPEGREFESLHSDHFPLNDRSECTLPVFAAGLACLIAAMAFTLRLLQIGKSLHQNPGSQRSALSNEGEYGF
jgi:hypothetical protein